MNQNTWVDRLAHRSQSNNHILIDIEKYDLLHHGRRRASETVRYAVLAAAENVAANHQPISRPTGSPSCTQATSAVRCFIPAWPFRSFIIEYRLRREPGGSAASLPRSTESVTCASTSR
jgi:hypothetical protein